MNNAVNTPTITVETVVVSTWTMTFDRTDQEMWMLINGTHMIPVDQKDVNYITNALRSRTPMSLVAYQGKRGFRRVMVRTTNADAVALSLVFANDKERRDFSRAFYSSAGMSHFG